MDNKIPLRLWLKLLKASRMIETELRERFSANFNTTLPRFDVMAALSQHKEGLKMSELSGELRVSNGNVTGIVERLLGDGLVERNSVINDRRILRVSLNEKGRSVFRVQARAHKKWVAEILGYINEEDALHMANDLENITKDFLTKKIRF